MKKLLILLVLSIFILSAGCSSTPPQKNYWRGTVEAVVVQGAQNPNTYNVDVIFTDRSITVFEIVGTMVGPNGEIDPFGISRKSILIGKNVSIITWEYSGVTGNHYERIEYIE
jgi:hypothetical protein